MIAAATNNTIAILGNAVQMQITSVFSHYQARGPIDWPMGFILFSYRFSFSK
jgi:hypothetical protein